MEDYLNGQDGDLAVHHVEEVKWKTQEHVTILYHNMKAMNVLVNLDKPELVILDIVQVIFIFLTSRI